MISVSVTGYILQNRTRASLRLSNDLSSKLELVDREDIILRFEEKKEEEIRIKEMKLEICFYQFHYALQESKF